MSAERAYSSFAFSDSRGGSRCWPFPLVANGNNPSATFSTEKSCRMEARWARAIDVENGLIQTPTAAWACSIGAAGKLVTPNSRCLQMRDSQRQGRLYIRIPSSRAKPWIPVHYCYEVQIDNQPEIQEERHPRYGTLDSLNKPLAPRQAWPREWNIHVYA